MNSAATGRSSVPFDGATPTVAATSASALVWYDKASNGYTIAVGGRSQTFLPENLDTSQSTATLSVYVKTSGPTTDSLTLTKAGISGRFTYRYVGSGFWQSTTTGAVVVSGSLDAFAYGAATPNGAVPRTGRSEYAVDLIGARTIGSTATGITGQGLTQVDFATGAIVTHGTAVTPFSANAPFSSEARLSSSSNSFSGTFRIDDFGVFQGTLDGRFFGPNAQEIGAAVSAKTGLDIMIGAIAGRGSTVTTANTTTKPLSVNDFFAADSARLTTTLQNYNGTIGSGFSGSSSESSALIVNYAAASNDYTLIGTDHSQYFRARSDISFGSTQEALRDTTPRQTLDGYDYATFTNLRYVTSHRWRRSVGSGGLLDYRMEQFVFGINTPDASVPRTGLGGYAIGLSATVADADFSNLAYINGFGLLQADFATGSMTASGSTRIYGQEQINLLSYDGTGTFNLNGIISSSTNSFTGSISFDGLGAYTGTHRGRFYGPNAEEIGAAFSATDGSGGTAVGTFAGGSDSAAIFAVPKISELTSPTDFAFSAVKPRSSSMVTGETVQVSYDPATATYSLSFRDVHLTPSTTYVATLSSANRSAGASDDGFDVYQGAMNGVDYRATLLKPVAGNTVLALSYTSLAIVVDSRPSSPSFEERHYIAFGQQTDSVRMPRSGSAQYGGIALGFGRTKTNAFNGVNPSVVTDYDLTGQASLTANFGTGSLSSSLTLEGTPVGGGAATGFGNFANNGSIAGAGFRLGNTGDMVAGRFFGGAAEEVGGTFEFSKTDSAGTLIDLGGVFAAKR
ncbi:MULTISPECIES: transferrin-binding protein-like solute binding protein [unclassified Sphingobium]|uniref:transferrin-binding protein-like solute binding protein n=1 Tax=unclassified Sphingobium TaxID=2611147 RepID=UPI0022259867|nr:MULTISPECIES: transferrin-binding protein-like solute binding protein [unclassified Sphingobium]MCW2395455.1 hypothetical protein [Sphingobium sp. B8D3B]MCW2418970.1 hypothetical protein [Sphingobium sp. B8D3C]